MGLKLPSAWSALYSKYERWVPITFFILGFLFDCVMLTRIDEPAVIIQQAVYLIISGLLIGVDLVAESRPLEPPRLLKWIWRYREALLHFLLGTLLNSYAIFYFKSASAFTSFFFIALLVVLLTLNEFKHFGKSQTRVHVAFLGLCVISYFVCLAPTLMGFIGTLPFLVAVTASLAVSYFYFIMMRRNLGNESKLLKTHVLYPFAATQLIFMALYFAHAIPPVPLSVKYMGIYHEAEKEGGEYRLTFLRPGWKFWQHGDQTFLARPGDTIYCYSQIFSPARFQDRLQVRWLYDDEKRGWTSSDAIPLAVSGGREEGYRAVTKKGNFQPGNWRVQIETMDNLEVGRINFEVIADVSTDGREYHHELR